MNKLLCAACGESWKLIPGAKTDTVTLGKGNNEWCEDCNEHIGGGDVAVLVYSDEMLDNEIAQAQASYERVFGNRKENN